VSQHTPALGETSRSEPQSKRTGWRLAERLRIGTMRQLALLPVIGVMLVVGSQLNSSFLTQANIFYNVLSASAVLAVVTVAESVLIIAGQFDLSLQSIVGFAPMVSAYLVVPKAANGLGTQLHPAFGLLVLFGVGALAGAINGFLVAKLRLNAFVVTLAMLVLMQGLTLGISSGQTMSSLPGAYSYVGNTTYLGVPADACIAIAVFVLAGLFMRYHVVGREIYAIGGNPEAARAAGVRVERVTFGLFVVAGLLAALAGLLLTTRISSVTANQGDGLIFTVFAAAVIGGIDLRGGRGRVVGAATGVVLIGLIQNILVVAQVSSYWVNAIYGLIILLSLMLGSATGSPLLDKIVRGPWRKQLREAEGEA
jgi:simple sugar transport system permease protein